MEEYLNKYYPDIKDKLTKDNIETIKNTVHYRRYLFGYEINKLKEELLKVVHNSKMRCKND